MHFGLFMLWYWSAYISVTLVAIAHTIFNWKVLGIENEKQHISSMYDVTPYAKTVPYHPLYNILIWPVFAYLYLSGTGSTTVWMDALILGASWTALTIILDLFGWVIVKHPWRMSFREMYWDYQPWITLIYLCIFISPLIAALFL